MRKMSYLCSAISNAIQHKKKTLTNVAYSRLNYAILLYLKKISIVLSLISHKQVHELIRKVDMKLEDFIVSGETTNFVKNIQFSIDLNCISQFEQVSSCTWSYYLNAKNVKKQLGSRYYGKNLLVSNSFSAESLGLQMVNYNLYFNKKKQKGNLKCMYGKILCSWL